MLIVAPGWLPVSMLYTVLDALTSIPRPGTAFPCIRVEFELQDGNLDYFERRYRQARDTGTRSPNSIQESYIERYRLSQATESG
ncbi:hypothetical protein C8Q77DRAFT_280219 [Trametes polyzona]|nr:hypothetical protein C8Q77DRAFT_280219 [Trametes polyzona]